MYEVMLRMGETLHDGLLQRRRNLSTYDERKDPTARGCGLYKMRRWLHRHGRHHANQR